MCNSQLKSGQKFKQRHKNKWQYCSAAFQNCATQQLLLHCGKQSNSGQTLPLSFRPEERGRAMQTKHERSHIKKMFVNVMLGA